MKYLPSFKSCVSVGLVSLFLLFHGVSSAQEETASPAEPEKQAAVVAPAVDPVVALQESVAKSTVALDTVWVLIRGW